MYTTSRVKGRVLYTEAVTLANATTANGSAFVVPVGAGFTAHINTGAVNTVGVVTTDLEGSIDGTNWSDINATFAADCDTATISSVYSAATSGDWPYYRLTYDCVGNDSPTVITVVVIANE